jgi:hypothetical protein
MDPYMMLSSRILHEERVASATRRSRLRMGSRDMPEQTGGWRELAARLLSFARHRGRSLEKRPAA